MGGAVSSTNPFYQAGSFFYILSCIGSSTFFFREKRDRPLFTLEEHLTVHFERSEDGV